MEKSNTFTDTLRKLGEASKHDEQGDLFLKETGSMLEVVEAVPQKPPLWWNSTQDRDIAHGTHYACTLTSPRGRYVFDFWGSIADAEMVELARTAPPDSRQFFKLSDFLKEKTGRPALRFFALGQEIVKRTREAIKPNAYSILTCLHDSAGEDFADFCGQYGYDEDSRTAERTYHAVLEQERNMRKLYTHEELEALAEVV